MGEVCCVTFLEMPPAEPLLFAYVVLDNPECSVAKGPFISTANVLNFKVVLKAFLLNQPTPLFQ